MDMVGITTIILGIFGALIIAGIIIYKTSKEQSSFGENLAVLSGIAIIIILIISIFTIVVPYWDSYSLPHEYLAACEAVEETKKLLVVYENITVEDYSGIGEGLEAMQLKFKLGEMVSEKHKLLGEINGWLSNPMMPFKDNIRGILGE